MINELSKKCQAAAVASGFESERRSFGDIISLMHSELSEALEEFRAGRGYQEVYFVEGKPEGIPIELADVVIRILQFCGYADIDMEDAIKTKMEYNATRPWKHGGKKL